MDQWVYYYLFFNLIFINFINSIFLLLLHDIKVFFNSFIAISVNFVFHLKLHYAIVFQTSWYFYKYVI